MTYGYNSLMPVALIVGNDSEIGALIANYLRGENWDVHSTSRRRDLVERLQNPKLNYCDMLDKQSIKKVASAFVNGNPGWNLIVLSIGQLRPIGRITDTDFDEWEESIKLNFLNQVYFIKQILSLTGNLSAQRRTILTFAGSGTNSAPINFSAYTLSKIGLIKATELFASEYSDCAFVSLGTGWIKSAIHSQTLEAGELAGGAFQETVRRLDEGDFGDPNLICDFISWMNSQPIKFISGLNFALQGDGWNSPDFIERVSKFPNNFKLRRLG